MEVKVEARDAEGKTEYVGLEVCRGPGVLHVVLTRPYRLAGRTVSVPLEDVESVIPVESGALGEPPKTSEDAGEEGK